MDDFENLLKNPLEEDGNFKLLKQVNFTDRTLICWHNIEEDLMHICLFNRTYQPNSLSRRVSGTQWGWPTHVVLNIKGFPEVAKIVELYEKDMKMYNFWWEFDDKEVS